MTFDPLRLTITLIPLAVYLLVIAMFNLGRRTVVVSGGRDVAALAVGVVGLVFVGPVELLLPRVALTIYGFYAWPMLLVLYSLCTSLIAMLLKPRLVLYNAVSMAELRPVLAAIVEQLDPETRWAGSTLSLPQRQIEFVVESHPLLRTITLTSTHGRQNLASWQILHASLAAQLPRPASRSRAWGVGLTTAALVMFAVIGWQLTQRSLDVAQALDDILRW